MQIIRKKRVKKHLITWNRIWWAFIIIAAIYTLSIAFTAFAAASRDIEIVQPEQKRDVIAAVVTAYTSSVDETDADPFITASGKETRRGVIACPSKLSFGTVVEFEGNEYICEDRMNRRYREQDRFDVWVPHKSEAYAWGLKQGEIVVVSEKI